jgi:hypothetical protein
MAYGGGYFEVEYDDKVFEYFLGECPDLTITGIADIDRDGSLDFHQTLRSAKSVHPFGSILAE